MRASFKDFTCCCFLHVFIWWKSTYPGLRLVQQYLESSSSKCGVKSKERLYRISFHITRVHRMHVCLHNGPIPFTSRVYIFYNSFWRKINCFLRKMITNRDTFSKSFTVSEKILISIIDTVFPSNSCGCSWWPYHRGDQHDVQEYSNHRWCQDGKTEALLSALDFVYS